MEKQNAKKHISALLAVCTASSVLCSCSGRSAYEVIQSTDTWYSCSETDIGRLFDPDAHDHISFDTVGTDSDSLYVSVVTTDLSGDGEEQEENVTVCRFSFDGELLESNDITPVSGDGIYRSICKVWISDSGLNILTSAFDTSDESISYELNGEEYVLPDVSNYYHNTVYVNDILTDSGYTLFNLQANSWRDTIAVVRPDGSFFEVDVDGGVGSGIDSIGEFVCAGPGKAVFPVYLFSGEMVMVTMDIASGTIGEITDMYGADGLYYMEYCSGKVVARGLEGFQTVDPDTGEMTPLFDYCEADASVYDLSSTETVYISEDNGEIVLAGETYGSMYDTCGGYRIMHLTREETNPNAGKTVLTVSNDQDGYPTEALFYGIYLYNSGNGDCFLRYVYNVEENRPDADIVICDRPVSNDRICIDIYPYLTDRGFDERAYFSGIIESSKSGGSMYGVPLEMGVSGIVTSSVNAPSNGRGFTYEEYTRFVDTVCNGADPMSDSISFMMGKTEHFTTLFMNSSDLFITDGRADLSGEEIREMLRYVDEHGSDHDMTVAEAVTEHNSSIEAAVLGFHPAGISGSSGAEVGRFDSFGDYIADYTLYGQGLGIYGMPSFDGRGPSASCECYVTVSADTSYPDACADFVMTLLSYDVQIRSERNPVNIDAFRDLAEDELMTFNSMRSSQRAMYFNTADTAEVPYDAIGRYMDLLSSASGVQGAGSRIGNIVREESSAYFSGQRSMDDVITVMQDRIETVLAEER